MESLWLAIAIYSVGLALVIWKRPTLMFNENGTWKEFGYQRSSRHTLFPVWLFAIVWAFVSYALAAALIWILTGRSLASASAVAAGAAAASQNRWTPSRGLVEEDDDEMAEDDDDEEEFTIPVSRVPRSNASRSRKPRPGYYVLDPETERGGGLRRYIYFGNSPPAED